MVYFLCKAYDSDRQNCYFAQSLPVRGAWVEMICAEVMTCYAIIPKNLSASSIAFSLSGGQISIFALSDFALL